MFFGGPNGFNIFHPENIPENKNIPPVYITGMHIFNKPQHPGEVGSFISSAFAETNEIKLSHKENMITFEFAALNYILPEKNLYAYKLEGLEKDWNYMGTKRNASYTNLEPGTYTFRVKASNNDSIWNEEGASLTIIITPPYWQTWWFRAIIGIGITGWLIGFYLFRMNNVGKQKQLLEQKVREQTRLLLLMNEEERKLRMQADETNKQLISKNSELQQFAYIASHDLQEPLRTTSGFVQLLQTKYRGKLDIDADKYLAFIAGSAERMKMLINDLLDFSKLGNNAKLTEIDCNELLQILQADLGAVIASTSATISVGEMPIIKGYATEIKLLFQNLIVNAIKFRKKNTAPLIAVSFEPIETGWQFCVSDNGIGIDKKYHDKIFRIFQRLHNKDEFEGSGIGLSHCAKIVDMHKGKIWILSEPEKGAAFYFTIQNPSE